jgi:hypothetical protein
MLFLTDFIQLLERIHIPYQGSLEDFGDCKIGGQVIRTTKYADSLTLRNKRYYRA